MHALPDYGMEDAGYARPNPDIAPDIEGYSRTIPGKHFQGTNHQRGSQKDQGRISTGKAQSRNHVGIGTSDIKHKGASQRDKADGKVMPY
jgi:hypothetical protein